MRQRFGPSQQQPSYILDRRIVALTRHFSAYFREFLVPRNALHLDSVRPKFGGTGRCQLRDAEDHGWEEE